jgi:predicted RecB family nuclease
MQNDTRKLRSLGGVGPAMEADFHLLGINTVEALASSDADSLYEKLCARTKTRQDPCVLDTFRCAVAQARNPKLPVEQRNWWWWSQRRKAGRI